jgi:hypothetical protein
MTKPQSATRDGRAIRGGAKASGAGLGARLLRYFLRPRVISVKEALRIIEADSLKPACDAWHFSWDIERFCETMLLQTVGGYLHVFAPRPLNEWTPVAQFTNCPTPVPLRTIKPEPLPYWFLRLTTFDDFLARRSALSSQPGAHFPSRQTYPSAERRMNCRLERLPLSGNEAHFAAWYDQLKNVKYNHTGEACWTRAVADNPGVPREWFTIYALFDNATKACKAVQLAISDRKSQSGINIAAQRGSGIGYGIFLDVEITRELCANGCAFVDCGISGEYGGYKRKVYLDALETISI